MMKIIDVDNHAAADTDEAVPATAQLRVHQIFDLPQLETNEGFTPIEGHNLGVIALRRHAE